MTARIHRPMPLTARGQAARAWLLERDRPDLAGLITHKDDDDLYAWGLPSHDEAMLAAAFICGHIPRSCFVDPGA